MNAFDRILNCIFQLGKEFKDGLYLHRILFNSLHPSQWVEKYNDLFSKAYNFIKKKIQTVLTHNYKTIFTIDLYYVL